MCNICARRQIALLSHVQYPLHKSEKSVEKKVEKRELGLILHILFNVLNFG